MVRTLTHQGISWHDSSDPSEKELISLQKKYGFHELDIEDCLSEHERPKVEEYDKYLFLVFHIPYATRKTGRILKEEINIFLGPNYLITLHEGKIDLFDDWWKLFQENRSERKDYMGNGSAYFLYELMNKLFEDLFPMLDSITKDIRRIESDLFESEEEVDLLRDIMTLKRNIITLRSILLPQRALVATLEHKNKKFVPDELALYFDDILDAIERQWSLLETAKEMIEALQGTHESWLTHRTNSVVRTLTVVSVTMLPLTLLSGIYGMNVALPYEGNPLAFVGILGFMLLILCGALAYFWKKKFL